MTAQVESITTTGNTTHYVQAVVPPQHQPTLRLFDVHVDGLLGFSLIPLTDLARDLAGAWLHGSVATKLVGVSLFGEWHNDDRAVRGQGMRVDKLECIIEPGALLSKSGDPFYTGMSLSAVEREVALEAVRAHRERTGPQPQPSAPAKAKPKRRHPSRRSA